MSTKKLKSICSELLYFSIYELQFILYPNINYTAQLIAIFKTISTYQLH